MNNGIPEQAIKLLLAKIHIKLKEAEQIAKVAQACSEAGSTPEAIRVSMDLDQYIFDVGRLHDAVAVLGRLTADY
ncbi:hypothetical protein [Bradyrhizobium guangzhouense]|uniref:Uncharacterized protein n=1 Tax=Bradyrhizobium guangzhouense TaxID=1325095 RepID=A0AAE5X526_9BRAD|nr:hypothetical protein [Bradyrhizobium guangzhouense]QAU48734.1 hypothetical protein XH91_27525 [Bradyrhizobium guangzhouense]